MNVLMLDDDAMFSALFIKIVANIDSNVNITAFENADNFFDHLYRHECDMDAVFIDIELGESSGIELAASISKKYENVPVVFLTGYPEKYCQSIFLAETKLKPFAFIAKPVDIGVVSTVLTKLYQADMEKNTSGFIRVNGHKENISIDEIVYIESNGRKVLMHCRQGNYTAYYSMKKLGELLPEFFVMPHTSFMVNCKYIVSYDTSSVLLQNDVKVPISRNRKNEFLHQLMLKKGFSKC